MENNIIINRNTYKLYLCQHNKNKYYCVDCPGAGICEHKKRRHRCAACGGGSLCEHKQIKSRCYQCGGNDLCCHGVRKYYCLDCKGSGFCEHGQRKDRCLSCGGSSMCEHNRRKSNCLDCLGSAYCSHGKVKYYCKTCDGRYLCKTPWCETYRNLKCNGFCLRCCIYLQPDIPVVRNYRTKEKAVTDFVSSNFPDMTWVQNKKVEDGCSKRRPDMLLDMGSHVVIIEVDEHQHKNYESICENKRIMEISQDLHHRPIIFIRFNPDGYENEDGEIVNSCWTTHKSTGIAMISKKKENEWTARLETLKQKIQYCIENQSEKTIEIIELFFD